ncbi:MAG: hypothetical protein QUS12_15810 [Methanosarcina sp.]|nr:hypothetical protein [Methanosarcina sp.]
MKKQRKHPGKWKLITLAGKMESGRRRLKELFPRKIPQVKTFQATEQKKEKGEKPQKFQGI